MHSITMITFFYGRKPKTGIPGHLEPKAIYFFKMSVLFETGELNAYVYDDGGLYRRKYV